MRIAAVTHVEMTVDTHRASAEITLKTQRFLAGLQVAGALVAMLVVLSPLWLIAADAASNPNVTNTVMEHPVSTLLLVAGMVFGMALLLVPLRGGLARLGGQTRVVLADGRVTVDRQGLTGRDTWVEPLSKYCGVTHHIRATLSGARHEIILVHPDPARDVLLNLSQRSPKDGADHFAELLGLPEIQPRTLYLRQRPLAAANDAAPSPITARAA